MIKVVLDTNVLMSGIFWSGPPSHILVAWNEKKIKTVISEEILNEYLRVGDILSKKYPGVDVLPIIDLFAIGSEVFAPKTLEVPVSRDLDDDKFIAVCLAANCKMIISGDRDLLDVSGYENIEVLKPADFVNNYLLKNTKK